MTSSEIFAQDWLVVFKTANQVYKIHNNREKLKEVIKEFSLLAGFNNHHYDDFMLAELLSDKIVPKLYELSQNIINIKNFKPKIRLNLPTIDVMQEMKMGVSLKEIEANLKMNIHETPIDFNIKSKLFPQEIEQVFKYCENDVNVTEEVFYKRKDYFQSKFEIIKEFNLNPISIKNTRANLVSKVLKCKSYKPPVDRLHLRYDPNIKFDNIPAEIIKFYDDIELNYRAGGDYHELEKESLNIELNGVPHIFGFGGLHGAVKNLVYEGNILIADVSSFYPSLMINNNFISRASESPELFKNVYKKRMDYKAAKDPRQGIYKILLNACFGATKSKYNMLFDPLQANNICVNGQLILTDLIMRLKNLSSTLQTNTDGIILAYDEKNLKAIQNICSQWELDYNLTLDYDYATKLVQRDVNSYCIKFKDGKIKTKGIFANNEGGNFERTSLSIIDMALTEYYMNNKDIDYFLIEQYKNDNLLPFQLIAKGGSTFKKIVHEYFSSNEDEQLSSYIDLQKVNRVFATNKKVFGSLYKIKEVNGIDKYHKIANCPDNAIVHNDSLDTFDKTLLDLNYYSELIKDSLIKREVALYETKHSTTNATE